jgi:hypothetical protein
MDGGKDNVHLFDWFDVIQFGGNVLPWVRLLSVANGEIGQF